MKKKADVRDLADIQLDLADLTDDLRTIRRRMGELHQRSVWDPLGIKLHGVISQTIHTLDGVVRDLFYVKED